MDPNEAEFMRKLLLTFKSEAEEHLKAISNGLLALEKKPSSEEHQRLLETIFREAHSLKGASRAVNLDEIQDLCQTIEHIFAAWKKHDIAESVILFDTLHQALDMMSQIIGAPTKEARQSLASQVLDLTQKLLLLLNPASVSTTASAPSQAPLPKENSPSDKEIHNTVDRKITDKQDTVAPFGGEKTVRVSISKLDHLLQEVEEMLNLKLSTNQQASSLKDLQMLLDKWKKNASKLGVSSETFQKAIEQNNLSAISQYSKKLINYFNSEAVFIKSIQEDINQAAKLADQEVRFVSSMVDNLLEDTKQALMQPFSTIFESFPRMVRDLSHSLEKKVTLECFGEDIEVDKRLLEELKDPLIHLIRNSIDHGIETPDQRKAKSKPPEGKITIHISQISGNKIELIFSDDGRGINMNKIKECGIKKGILTSAEASQIDEKELLKLLVQSEISTKEIVTELSGRGLGLSIIQEKIEKLHGHLSIENHEGAGVTFKMILPTTLATFRGVHVEVSGRQFMLPTHHVLRVVKAKRTEIKHIENKHVIAIDDRILPLVHLGNLLNIPASVENRDQEEVLTLTLMIVKASEKMIALEVDKVYGEKDILVKGLGKLLAHVKYVTAATITEWGKVIPILNPQDLIKSAMKGYRETIAQPSERIKPTILLCEDSITSRMLLYNVLESSGYQVKSAIDGEEGLFIFEHEKIDLVLTDIEMPRMDGLTLTQKIRAMEKGRDIPIILCTSRESQEDKERGIKAGANAYLEKSSFTQSSLLDVIHQLL